MSTFWRLFGSALLIAGPSLIDWVASLIHPAGIDLVSAAFNATWVSCGIFLLLFFELNFHRRMAKLSTSLAAIEQAVVEAPVTVERLPDEEFYTQFLTAVRRSSQYVWISYFKSEPPNEEKDETLRSYYAAVLSEIKNKKRVKFRRIVLDTEHNRQWIATMCQSLERDNCTNIDIYFLKQKSSEHAALSVQIVDDARVWVVALGEHQSSDGFRDLYIESEDAATMLKKYYERLVDMSELVFKDGKVIPNERSTKRRGSTVTPARASEGGNG